jgi:hypothetical protein
MPGPLAEQLVVGQAPEIVVEEGRQAIDARRPSPRGRAHAPILVIADAGRKRGIA